MFKCIFIKRKLYDYLDNSLSEKERIKVKEHLEICPVCQKRLNQMSDLIGLVKNKSLPQPSEDFWHNFGIELDKKLNTRLIPPFNFKPNLSYRLKPALVLPLVSIVILALSLYLYFYGRSPFINRSDLALVDEISLLEEVNPELSLNHAEDAYIEELNLFYQLNQNPT